MAEKATKMPKSVKAQITRASLVVAAAAILREQGPSGVTYRRVAEWAGASSSSVGYYFESISELLSEAAQHNITIWTQRAEGVAHEANGLEPHECQERIIELLMRACLPEELNEPAAHYAQLVQSAESEVVVRAYKNGCIRIRQAVAFILERADVLLPSELITITVDGAAIMAISEHYDVYETVEEALKSLFEACHLS